SAIEPAVAQMERDRAARKHLGSLGAWEAYQRGLWHLGRISVAESEEAKSFLRRAIEFDPNFAPAYAALSRAVINAAYFYQSASHDEATAEALQIAQRAVSLDPLNAAARLRADPKTS